MHIVWKSLAATVLLSAVVPVFAPAEKPAAPVLLDNPDGKGQPTAVTCRKPQQMPGSRLMVPPVCLINADWAKLRRDGQDVSPDGKVVASEKARSLHPAPCSSVTNTGRSNPMGASMGAGLSFSPTCF